MPPPSKADLWSAGVDETVEVNQRALIDKILARYSGENTIFRELLQNADDAGAHHVQVKFYTEAGIAALEKGERPSRLPDAKKDLIHRYVVTNDGIPFRTEDWKRLKKIAEGNPDEEKIGAFGVGFYSLWSVCDDPFVESGDKWMGFYWKDGKDQLLARSGDLPPAASSSSSQSSSSGNPWTSFTMALREPTLLEGPLDLARFFITSLTFMRTMRQIDMLVDDVKVLEVERSLKGKERVQKKGLKQTSQAGMMTVTGVDATGMVITAKVMQWLAATGFTQSALPAPIASLAKPAKAFSSFLSSSFFGRSTPSPAPPAPPPPPEQDPYEVTSLSREIQIYQADIKVTVSPAFGRELERATKKAPPKVMPASLVFARGDEETIEEAGSDGKKSNNKDTAGVFSGLCPSLDGEQSAKVFIGQATGQTTGIGGHLAARFIPTVERESIDLVDKHVSHWNKELLWIGGYLSRLIYELEMQELHTLWSTTSVKDTEMRTKLLARGLHALRFFSFRPTTPSAMVGQGMEAAFYGCGNDNKILPIPSTAGILPLSQVRMPNLDIQKFLPDMPVVTTSTIEEASRFVARLREQGLLREISLEDVIRELTSRPLTEHEMVECLRFWENAASMNGYTPQIRARLLDAAVLIQDNGKIVPLGVIETFVKPQSSSIPTDMPLPQHTLPYSITKDLRGNSIYNVFGWTELSILQYIQFLISPQMSSIGQSNVDPETDIRSSPAFAERVLAMLGRAWQSISANQQSAIALELKNVPCIPTKAGFKVPEEAYFEKNLLFDDLPTIALPKNTAIKGGMEKMLLAIGVRRTVNLQLVFSRLIGGGTWTCQDLMKYLVSVKDTLTTDEIARLRQTAAFPLEIESPDKDASPVRRKPNQLYEPLDTMRELGLPLLDWGEGKWRSNSEEAKMLIMLGLRRFPPVETLLGIAAGPAPMNAKALAYLLANVGTHYTGFDPSAFREVAFIPAVSSTGQRIMAKPGNVFTNSECAILGFAVAEPSIATPENAMKLRILSDPPMDKLVSALLSSITTDRERARKIFEYMSTRLGSAITGSLEPMSTAAFIPIKTETDIRLAKAKEVYFTPRNGEDSPFKSAFTFIDFGERANVFLRMCGVQAEPSVKDIASLLAKDPSRMLKQAGSPERYLEQLRLLAANWTSFNYLTRTQLQTSSFVLASRQVPVKQTSKKVSDIWSASPSEYEREWVLAKASDVAVVDSITMLQYFGQHVLAAPEEQLLETFYEQLGAKTLSSQVQTRYVASAPTATISAQAQALRRHVLERLTIFLAEARRRSSGYTAGFLAKDDNFEIQEVRDLKAKYTYTAGKQEHNHLEVLYAMAKSKGKGKGIVLVISLSAQQDDYDIAAALCNILLKSPKADDALLLNSILSTPLVALRKRGFNVDRILNQQREERMRVKAEVAKEQAEQAQAEQALIKGRRLSGASEVTATTTDNSSTSTAPSISSSGTMKGLLDRFRRNSRDNKDKSSALLPPMPGAFGGMGMPSGWLASGGDAKPGSVGGGFGSGGAGERSGNTTKRPSSQQNIRNTVQKAVDASRPERATQISDSRHAVKDVSESQGDYCDLSAGADIVMAVDHGPNNIKIWVPRDVASDRMGVSAFLTQDRIDIAQRFERHILLPIAEVYKLAPNVMNIFWDHEGPTIAFNRGGAIFCNARYYQAWHDNAVLEQDFNGAFISWYFSIAHELAHNLEAAHNASHEFYFSSIAEEYLVAFTKVLR